MKTSKIEHLRPLAQSIPLNSGLKDPVVTPFDCLRHEPRIASVFTRSRYDAYVSLENDSRRRAH